VLRRALPGHHVHDTDAPQAPLLRLQHDPPLLPNHPRRPARFLHPQRLRGEGVYGDYHTPVDDRVSHAGRGEHAADVRRLAVGR